MAFVIVAGAGVSVGAALVQPDPSTGASRIERTVANRWKAEYVGSPTTRAARSASPVCVGAIPFRTRFTTPAGHQTVDMTVTATLDYRTSSGDGVSVDADLYHVGGNEVVALRPAEHRLAPSRARTSTTLQWIKEGVQAAGREYALALQAEADCRLLNRSFAAGRRTTVVVETWTAGD